MPFSCPLGPPRSRFRERHAAPAVGHQLADGAVRQLRDLAAVVVPAAAPLDADLAIGFDGVAADVAAAVLVVAVDRTPVELHADRPHGVLAADLAGEEGLGLFGRHGLFLVGHGGGRRHRGGDQGDQGDQGVQRLRFHGGFLLFEFTGLVTGWIINTNYYKSNFVWDLHSGIF